MHGKKCPCQERAFRRTQEKFVNFQPKLSDLQTNHVGYFANKTTQSVLYCFYNKAMSLSVQLKIGLSPVRAAVVFQSYQN